jgi:UTP--glucose-1-phosphate uridylyltransferase
MLPVTRTVPKMLLPVGTIPLIHRAVKEAADAGFEKIVLIVSPGMDFVGDYFNNKPLLEAALTASGKSDVLDEQLAITELAEIVSVEQHEAKGNGHAVLMARDEVGDEPFALIWPDELFWGNSTAIEQVLSVWREQGGNVIGVVEVPDRAIPLLGIVSGNPISETVWNMTGMVEKPTLAETPSNLAMVGPYLLTPEVFDALEQTPPGAGGEIQITDGIAARIGIDPAHACVLQGSRIDTGNPAGMVAATIFESQQHPESHAIVEAVLEQARLGAKHSIG